MAGPSQYGKMSFCPKCGCNKIKRDFYPAETFDHTQGSRHPKEGVEYICELCGFGFLIGKSRRVYMADRLHREHRQLRANVQFSDQSIDPDVASTFLATLPQKPR
jgi:predicted RNA-binding Zn-ribbon protein involved in translation (DUF1610 family)